MEIAKIMGRSENWVKNNWKRVLKREKIPSNDERINEKVEGLVRKLTQILENEVKIGEGDKKGSNDDIMVDAVPSKDRYDGGDELNYIPDKEEMKDSYRRLWPSGSSEEYKAADLMSLGSDKLSKPPTLNNFDSDSNMVIELMEKTGITGDTIYPNYDYNDQ